MKSGWRRTGFGHCRVGDGKLFTVLKTKLEALNKSKASNMQDALIAEVAIVNGYSLVTADSDLCAVAVEHGCNVIHFNSNTVTMNSHDKTGVKYYDKANQYLLSSLLMAIGRFALIAFIVFAILKDARFRLPHDLINAFFIVSGSIWVVSIILSVLLTIPLRCSTCGQRIAVITSNAKIPKSYVDRERAEILVNKLINFFIPLELFSKRVHCVRCDQEYSLDKNVS